MMNELFQTAADSLLMFCGEDATLRTADSAQTVRAAPLSLLKQNREDANGSTARTGRSILIRTASAIRFLPGKSRLELQSGNCLIVSASALPGGGLYQLETEEIQ